MTTVICDVKNCPYRSKTPMRKYTNHDGSKCYQCKLDTIIMDNIFDPDGETLGLFGYTPAECIIYAKYREAENERV